MDGVLTISGNGGMGDYTQTTMPWYDYKNEVTSIVVEEGITSIGSWAFCQFVNVTSVSIPSTVTRIGSYAFYNADGLTSLPMGDSVTAIEAYAFYDCSGLYDVLDIPRTVLDIGAYAFAECGNVAAVILNEGVETVGEGAFSNCTGMKQFIFYASVTHLDLFVLGGCTGLQYINISEDNAYYTTLDGVLFNKTMTRLIQFPAGKGGIYEVPETVTIVESHAFRECGSLQWVEFQADAPTFGQYAFYNTTATVRYPRGNSTWTADVKQQYGGALTWNSYVPDGTPSNLMVLTDEPFSYYSEIVGSNASYTFDYDESWFFAETPGYNHELSRMSMCVALAAARTGSSSIESLFESLGLADTAEYFYPTPTTETIGYAIGSKDIINEDGEAVTLIAVAVRGGGYKDEWHNNLIVGNTSEHQGFTNAATKVAASVRAHIEKMGYCDNIKIWITGFSRGAAVSNIAAHQLAADGYYGRTAGLEPDGVMAYCFECPMGVRQDDPGYAYDCGQIYNIVNPLDVVPMVAPEAWNFGRYGITYYLPSNAVNYSGFVSAFSKMENEYANILKAAGSDETVGTYSKYTKTQNKDLTDIVDALIDFIGSQYGYVVGYQDTVAGIVLTFLGTESDPVAFAEALVEGLPAFAILHPALTGKLVSNVGTYFKAHRLELCLAWLNSLNGDSLKQTARARYLTANCPVDVSVYDSTGTLAAQIINDEVQEIEGSTIGAMVDENGQKVVCLPLDEEFEIVVTATDDGTMSYQVAEYDIGSGETTRVVNYYDVEITEGDTLTGTAGVGTETDAEYTLKDADGIELTPTNELTGDEVSDHTVTVSSEGNGTVTGGGLFVTGEYAMVTAKADEGEEFLGWYVDDALVSMDAEYRFRVDSDVQIAGKFTENVIALDGVYRIYGNDRIATSYAVANQLKETLGVETFDTIIVASALNFPDALTGSYLAAVKNAPILLTSPKAQAGVIDYIASNLTSGGTVCILGGESAVAASFETDLTARGISFQRLAGKNRFGTNLKILEEAGVNQTQEVLICTATGFADSLSASAAGLPILLVHGSLTEEQKDFLATTSGKFVIIGGTSAVSTSLEAELKALGTVDRVGGANRYETSVLVAQRFVPDPDAVVLAYARNYPDGLCGGPLAMSLNAALILTDNYDPSAADAYVDGITAGIVVGGEGLISDSSARTIFDLAASAVIEVK